MNQTIKMIIEAIPKLKGFTLSPEVAVLLTIILLTILVYIVRN